MRKMAWKKWALVLSTGAIALQTVSCADAAPIVSAWANAITAGSALMLVREILL